MWGGLTAPEPAGVWGTPGSLCSHGHAHGAQRRDEHGASLGGPPPPWPSPAGGGNRAPPRREGVGETRFPHIFTSELDTPLAFVYSFPLRWPISPRRPRKPIPEQVKPVEGLRPPKPSRGRALFASESATPRAFVYSFPLRWPISPRRPRKPIPEQVKPVEGLRPPKPSRGRALFTSAPVSPGGPASGSCSAPPAPRRLSADYPPWRR